METKLSPNKIFASLLLHFGKNPNYMRKYQNKDKKTYAYYMKNSGQNFVYYIDDGSLVITENHYKYMGGGYERMIKEESFLVSVNNGISIKKIKEEIY